MTTLRRTRESSMSEDKIYDNDCTIRRMELMPKFT